MSRVILLDPREAYNPEIHPASFPLGQWGVYSTKGPMAFFWVCAGATTPGLFSSAAEIMGYEPTLEQAKRAARQAARRTFPSGVVLRYDPDFARAMFQAHKALTGKRPPPGGWLGDDPIDDF